MPAVLSPDEKARCRRVLGYPEVESMASMAMGVPKILQMSFLIETALNQVMEVSLPRLRQLLGICEKIEATMVDAIDYLAAESVGDIKLRGAEAGKTHPDLLEQEYHRWANRLADLLGVPFNAFSARTQGGRSGNIPVR